jgi:hypothetical protein
MPSLQLLHEHTFAGKPLESFKVYNDPFGESEVCVELAFTNGQVACLCMGPGRPQIVSSQMCHEIDQRTDARSRPTPATTRWPNSGLRREAESVTIQC